MSTIGSTTPTSSSSSSSPSALSSADPYSSLTPADFIQMMVTQLQNQDPTQPTSNEDILQQISQIGQLESSDTLQTDLSQMVLQNSISSAGNLIGKTVQGVDSSGNTSSGIVNSVQVANGAVSLQLDTGLSMLLSNVQGISPTSTTNGTATSSTTPTTGTTTPSS